MAEEFQGWVVAHTEGSALSLSEHLYLFDIVASLCAGLNEHDIQFLSSLLALLRGDLSTRAERGRGPEGPGWTEPTDAPGGKRRSVRDGERRGKERRERGRSKPSEEKCQC